MNPESGEIIRPVILPVPAGPPGLMKGPEAVRRLSLAAREALAISCRRSGAVMGAPEKNAEGVPVPTNGWHWSVSHKPEFAAGVAARQPVGIDVEKIRPVSEALVRRTGDAAEWELFGRPSMEAFFRLWTAKEAVLKAEGVGIRGWRSCRIETVFDPKRIAVVFRRNRWRVEQFFFSGHLAAVACPHAVQAVWTVL